MARMICCYRVIALSRLCALFPLSVYIHYRAGALNLHPYSTSCPRREERVVRLSKGGGASLSDSPLSDARGCCARENTADASRARRAQPAERVGRVVGSSRAGEVGAARRASGAGGRVARWGRGGPGEVGVARRASVWGGWSGRAAERASWASPAVRVERMGRVAWWGRAGRVRSRDAPPRPRFGGCHRERRRRDRAPLTYLDQIEGNGILFRKYFNNYWNLILK